MKTKFTAFQLDSDGSSFSFYKSGRYTLIEARIPKAGLSELVNDLKLHGRDRIDKLHITSWDDDHCKYDDLIQILNQLRPDVIEIPSYTPETESGQLCKKTIQGYDDIHQGYKPNVVEISKEYLATLTPGASWGTTEIAYPSDYESANSNDKSLIRLFRSEGFHVLSLGDCESAEIAKRLMQCNLIRTEVDVLILPHHGADNGFITGEFLDTVKPKIAISSSNHGNQYEHPSPNIRSLLTTRNIPLFTTKHGNVLIKHLVGEDRYGVHDYKSDNEKKEPVEYYTPKRSMN